MRRGYLQTLRNGQDRQNVAPCKENSKPVDSARAVPCTSTAIIHPPEPGQYQLPHPRRFRRNTRVDITAEYEYTIDNQGVMWRTKFTTGRRERVEAIFAGMDADSPRRVSSDDRELIFVITKRNGRFVTIEDLFSAD